MATRPALVIVAAISLVTLALTAVGLTVIVVHAGARGDIRLWSVAIQEIVWSVSFLVGGTLIVAKTPRSPLGWLALGVALVSSCITWFLGMRLLGSPLWLAAFVHWTGFTAIAVNDMALLVLVLLFPDGRLAAPWLRWLVLAVGGTGLLQYVASLVHNPTLLADGVVPSPLYSAEWAGLGLAADNAGYLGYLLCWVGCLWSLAHRARGLDPVVRRQITLVLPVAVVAVLAETVQAWFSASSYLWIGVTLPDAVFGVLRISVALLAPLWIGYVITRSRLYQLDRAVRASAVVITVVTILGLGYVLAAGALSSLLSGTLAVGVLTGAAGIGLVPLIGWVRRRVDRAFYGERAEPMRAMRMLSDRLADRVDPAEIPLVVCQSLVSLFRLTGVAIETDTRILGAAGDTTTGTPERFALRYGSADDHRLLVWPRPGEEALDATDSLALRSVADQVGPALVASSMIQRDQASSNEAHQRLRRDLHDSLGPTLAAIVLQLGAAKALVPARSAAGPVLDTCTEHLREVIDEMRRLARNQQPLTLREVGLPEALCELAARLSTPDTPVSVDLSPSLPALPAAVRRAVYLIAAEAVTNAVRHAAANRITVCLREAEGVVRLEISDDGTGIADSGAVGVGLDSMRHRADELGGHWELASRPSGTTVSVVLPVGVS